MPSEGEALIKDLNYVLEYCEEVLVEDVPPQIPQEYTYPGLHHEMPTSRSV